MFFINHTDIGEGSAAIIEVEGPLNSDSAPDFDEYISKLLNNNVISLLIDMKNLKFISSEGIGAILMIQKSINERNGLAVFFNMNNEIISLFKLLGFDKVFTAAADRADALNLLDRHMELFPGESQSGKSENIKTPFLNTNDEPSITDFETDEPLLMDEFEEFDGSNDLEDSDESFVIECIKCRSLVRVRESGEQLCPYCSAEFTVTKREKSSI